MANVIKSSTASVSVVAMIINLKPMRGHDPFTLRVEDSDTVESVKVKIEYMLHIKPELQLLMFEGQVLEDQHTLADYGIHSGSTIYVYELAASTAVVRPTNIAMRIVVKPTWGEDPFALVVEDSDTVESVKVKIEHVLHSRPNLQLLVFDGQVLQDQRTLAYYGIHSGSAIDLYVLAPSTVVVRPTNNAMTINIKPMLGQEPFSLRVEDSDKVESVKVKIEHVLHIIPERQLLKFEGQVLENKRTLAYYGIHSGSTMELYELLTGS